MIPKSILSAGIRIARGSVLIISVFVLEWIIAYRVLLPENAGYVERDQTFTIAAGVAIPATVLTVYLFNRFAPPRKNSS